MTGSTHFGRVLVGSRRLVLIDRKDAMRAVATTASRRIVQPGQQQSLAVFARQVTVDQRCWLIMAGAAALDLVDRGHGGRAVCDFVNGMGSAVTVSATRLTPMNAAPCRTQHAAVALAAAAFVGQRLKVGILMLHRDIRMALLALDIRMRR